MKNNKQLNVLFVYSGNRDKISPFIQEQIYSLSKEGINVYQFAIKGRGIIGYLRNVNKLYKLNRSMRYSVIHAHYGYSGLLCALSFCWPLIITFHGTDVSNKRSRIISIVSMFLSNINIFVSQSLIDLCPYVKIFNKNYIIPCGVDLDLFQPKYNKNTNNDNTCRILFSSSIQNPIKNYKLASKAINLIDIPIELIELNNKSRNEVAKLMNKVDLLLLTSFSEGSPQVIKEAMSCNCPIVATDVGDIRYVIDNTNGCYITSFDPKDISKKINQAFNYRQKSIYTNGRMQIKSLGLDTKTTATKIYTIYKKITEYN